MSIPSRAHDIHDEIILPPFDISLQRARSQYSRGGDEHLGSPLDAREVQRGEEGADLDGMGGRGREEVRKGLCEIGGCEVFGSGDEAGKERPKGAWGKVGHGDGMVSVSVEESS